MLVGLNVPVNSEVRPMVEIMGEARGGSKEE